MNDGAEDKRQYSVVANDEEQYSIWVHGRSLPAGWHEVGKTGSKSDCLDYIGEVWTDMRPKSLRQSMDAPGLSAAG
ncbi:MbtH family protein [Streptomyces sp. uw30]|uniref:MbtH family protein n=1 Tax=Streptomyces sp. uw30 TaxID=1828179 RepID=UPI0021C62AEE|nr:MbtH family NRPS accessory protein [Streptomyces sp. uw30]